MKLKLHQLILMVFIFLVVGSVSQRVLNYVVIGEESTASPDESDLKKQIKKYEEKISSLKNRADTLANEIDSIDSQVILTELKIRSSEEQIVKTEKQIERLSGDIEDLRTMIEKLTNSMVYQKKVLSARLRERYKSQDSSPITVLFGFTTLENLVQKNAYLKVMELQDNKLITEMNTNKQRFDTQKIIFEDTKTQQETLKARLETERYNLGAYRTQLVSQQAEKERLLSQTKNDEAKYQQLLSQARAELEGIQAILGGQGVESSGDEVKAGQKIATVIAGSSCNSMGSHLHFAVKKNGQIQNPFSYLKKGGEYVNCSGSYCGSGDGDSFNPSGSWPWPLSGKIQFVQGYGNTWATRYNAWVRRIYSFHDGIDILGGSLTITSVSDGTFYRGSYTGGSGCQLRYVRVDHKDGVQSYYLHVNY